MLSDCFKCAVPMAFNGVDCCGCQCGCAMQKKMKIGSLPQPGTDFEGVWN